VENLMSILGCRGHIIDWQRSEKESYTSQTVGRPKNKDQKSSVIVIQYDFVDGLRRLLPDFKLSPLSGLLQKGVIV